MAAWRVTDSIAIGALIHAVYSTIETQAAHKSPIQKNLKTIIRKVAAAQTRRTRRPGNPDAYMERT